MSAMIFRFVTSVFAFIVKLLLLGKFIKSKIDKSIGRDLKNVPDVSHYLLTIEFSFSDNAS